MKKFVSKSANYSLVLRNAIPAEPMTGRASIPGLSVRFEDGVAIVQDDAIVKLMLENQYFNVDFRLIEEEAQDPYASRRKEVEPAHTMTEMQFGTPVRTHGSEVKANVPPELTNFINKAIQDGIKEGMAALIPAMMSQVSAVASAKAASNDKKVGKKVTKKSATKTVDVPTPITEGEEVAQS